MLFINHLRKDEWWEFDKEKMMAFNYTGGCHSVDEKTIKESEICECESWHNLYLAKRFCPLQTDVSFCDVWISPDGIFYDGDAHDVKAEYLCDIVYGIETDMIYAGDELESHGWIRATTSLMWDVRFDEWKNKCLTQKQYDALWDWCLYHKMQFPTKVGIRKENLI